LVLAVLAGAEILERCGRDGTDQHAVGLQHPTKLRDGAGRVFHVLQRF
jgi:hypothetical protein